MIFNLCQDVRKYRITYCLAIGHSFLLYLCMCCFIPFLVYEFGHGQPLLLIPGLLTILTPPSTGHLDNMLLLPIIFPSQTDRLIADHYCRILPPSQLCTHLNVDNSEMSGCWQFNNFPINCSLRIVH